MKFTSRQFPNGIPNGTILIFGISYPGITEGGGDDANRGMTPPKVFTYVGLKAGGLWYFTGSGRVPTAADWMAVQRWLERDNRVLEYVKVVTDLKTLWPEPDTDVDTMTQQVQR